MKRVTESLKRNCDLMRFKEFIKMSKCFKKQYGEINELVAGFR